MRVYNVSGNIKFLSSVLYRNMSRRSHQQFMTPKLSYSEEKFSPFSNTETLSLVYNFILSLKYHMVLFSRENLWRAMKYLNSE